MNCAQCGKPMGSSTDYQYEGHQFCSQGCLDDYRRDTMPTDADSA